MNHRPFEDWLLEDRPLSGREQRELQVHLHGCPSCAAIAESNLALHSTHLTPAPAGFADRFNAAIGKVAPQAEMVSTSGYAGARDRRTCHPLWVAGAVVQQALQSPAAWITASTVYLVFAVESPAGLD